MSSNRTGCYQPTVDNTTTPPKGKEFETCCNCKNYGRQFMFNCLGNLIPAGWGHCFLPLSGMKMDFQKCEMFEAKKEVRR